MVDSIQTLTADELEGPAGTDLTGWSVVLYNGNGGASYNTRVLSGAIPNLCGGRGVIALSYPSNGIQNGNPDGFALVNAGGQVVEFRSYGGTFAATNGAALGMTSTDIGVAESGSTPIGHSLKRHDDGNWYPDEYGLSDALRLTRRSFNSYGGR